MFSFNRNSPIILRSIKDSEKIYLTFDDGPDPDCTPQVLDLLLEFKVKSSFFVIGHAASKNSSLLARMIKEGHTLYSHSIDHKYNNFFASEKRLQQWVQNSQDHLSQMTGVQSKLFRPPAGVITPPLLRIATRLDLKLILWSHRFYDALWTLEPKNIKNKVDDFKNGEIILLHDRQRIRNREKFINSLKILLETMNQKQFAMAPIIEQEII